MIRSIAEKFVFFAFVASVLSSTPQSVAPAPPLSRASSPFRTAAFPLRQPSETSSTADTCSAMADDAFQLRIILINDVYELKNWPNFCTAVHQLSKGKTIVVLAGDFVGPSLLSSYDNARGMIDCMNRCGIQYVCFGNHEADIPHPELIKRIRESKFQWINSNMQNLDLDGIELPDHVVITVEDGESSKRVGLLGLVTEDPSLYQLGAFNGASILPLDDTAEKLRKQLLEQERLDLIIPITHQSMVRDREFARRFREAGSENGNAFPLIIGGHDHAAYVETVEGAHIVKTSCDMQEIAVCDVVWPDPTGGRVSVSTTLFPISSFEPDLSMTEVVATHLQVLTELDRAPLFVPGLAELSSKHNRLKETRLCSRFASETRDMLGSDCCLINAGNIRGNREYETGKAFFSYNDLRSEVPFDCEVVVVSLPGAVLQQAVAFSRARAAEHPPHAAAAFLHLDDRMHFDPATQTLTQVAGAPFDAALTYSTAVLLKLLTGVDRIKPLVEWAKGRAGELLSAAARPDGAGSRRLKGILVESWSRAIWWELGVKLRDARGQIRREDVEAAAAAAFGHSAPAVWLDNVMKAADADQDGEIAPAGLLKACFFSRDARKAMGWDGHARLQRAGLTACARELLGEQHYRKAAESVWQELEPTGGAASVASSAVAHWMASRSTQGGGPGYSLPTPYWVPGESLEREELRVCKTELQAMAGVPRTIKRDHSFPSGSATLM